MPRANRNRFAGLGRGFEGKTHYLFVLDASGSMYRILEPTLSGFNETLGDIRREDPEAPVTVVLFNSSWEALVACRPASEVEDLTRESYVPGGNTALYDALAGAVQEHEPRVLPGDRALVVVVTDGQENASKQFDRGQAMALVSRLEGAGNWTFTYLSASPEAFTDAANLGLRGGNSGLFTASLQGTQEAWEAVRSARRGYAASAVGQTADFYSGGEEEQPPPWQRDPGSSTG